jgi:hypothetical protein
MYVNSICASQCVDWALMYKESGPIYLNFLGRSVRGLEDHFARTKL